MVFILLFPVFVSLTSDLFCRVCPACRTDDAIGRFAEWSSWGIPGTSGWGQSQRSCCPSSCLRPLGEVNTVKRLPGKSTGTQLPDQSSRHQRCSRRYSPRRRPPRKTLQTQTQLEVPADDIRCVVPDSILDDRYFAPAGHRVPHLLPGDPSQYQCPVGERRRQHGHGLSERGPRAVPL